MIKITKTNKPNIILDESLATDAKIEKDIKQTTEFGEGEVLKSIEKCEQNALETEKELEKTAEPVLDITAKEHEDEVFGKLEEQLNEGIYVVDRKELAKYIRECYENKLSFSVKRSVKEGFRYCLTKGLNEDLDEETKGDAIDELVSGGTCKNRAEAEEYLAKADIEEKPFEEPVEESLGVKFANFYKEAENADTDMSVFESLVEKYNPSLDEDIDVIVDSMSIEDKNLLFETYLDKKEEVLTEAAETNSQKVLRTLSELSHDMNTGVETEECLKEEKAEVCPECGKEECECEKAKDEALTEAEEDKEETEEPEAEEVEEETVEEEPETTEEEPAEPEVKVEIDVEEPKELPVLTDDDIDFTFFEPLDSTLDDEITVDEPVDLEAKYNAGDLDYEDMVDSISFITADEDNPIEENKAFNFDIYKTEDGKYVAFGNDTPFGPADDVEELKNQIRDFMGDSEFTVTEEEETFNIVKDESNFTDNFGDDETELVFDEEPETEEEIVDVEEKPAEEELPAEEDEEFTEEEPDAEKVEDEEIYDEDESDLDLASFDR